MAKYLILVESPSKGKTLTKFLSSEYKVLASYGHIRDLPKNTLGFDPENDFKPTYVVSPDKTRTISEMKKYIDKDTIVYLASDEDREGEAISWHILETLKLHNHETKRIVFHEITKPAILHAIANPVKLDMNMVDAQQARRILDRAVGYKLSPLLWKKIKFGLSAGRVQSVVVRIVVDKENEILAFVPEEYWKVKLDILSNPSFKAELSKVKGKVTKITNGNDANKIKSDCDSSDYILNNVEEKDSFRNPPPPFTTSTLQQEASTKAGLSPKQTMMIAQKLYEGSMAIPNHSGGLITYMRTDSLNLSTVALQAAKEVIISEYGSEYTLNTSRTYNAKGNGKVAAQEAHEAIRPVNMAIKPSDLVGYVDGKELRLYTLIWQRTIATQMQQAKVANTTYKILGGGNKDYEFVAKGTKIIFPGFMKAYTEGTDDPDKALDNKEKFLPNVNVGTVFKDTNLVAEQNFTNPPARYSEASLIKKMEAEGIGRPSTYAATLSTILTRGYVELNDDKKLFPTVMGNVVTEYLKDNFPNIVDLAFTANIETEFDKIANGEMKWQTVMHNFYDDFVKNVDSKEGTERVQYSEGRVIGIDPRSGKDLMVKTGQYGTYLQIGETNKELGIKAKISPLPKNVSPNTLTLEEAIHYSEIPKSLGIHQNGQSIIAGIGRFGSYLQVGKSYYSIKPNDLYDVYTITLEQALDTIKKVDEDKANSLIWSNDSDKYGNLKIIKGIYGLYLNRAGNVKGQPKANFKIPKNLTEDDVRKLTLDEVIKIMDNQPPSSGKKFNKKK